VDAFYWPTTDRLAFEFATTRASALAKQEATADAQAAEDPNAPTNTAEVEEEDDSDTPALSPERLGMSSGEWQIRTLEEIVLKTNAKFYLMDEWDANLDANNRARAQALVDQLAMRARVVEISHRDGRG
jgi:ABC-type transport system involved in cytochrome bd biosynthesis fused ATPase/permease subunit